MKLIFVVAFALLAFSGLNAQKLSLKNALGMPEAHELDVVDMDADNSLGDIVSGLLDRLGDAKGILFEALERALDKFLELIASEKAHLSERVKAVLASLKSKIDLDPLKKLIAKLVGRGDDTNSITHDEEIVEELAEHLIEDITTPEGLKKIRDYVEKLASKSKLDVVHALRTILQKLDDSKLKEAITSLLSGRQLSQNSLYDIFQAIKEMFKTFGKALVAKFKPFRDWIISKWADIKAKLADKVSIIKAIGQELLGHGKVISKAVAEEAKSLLARYKKSLGDLYKPLMEKLTGIEDATTVSPTL